MGIVPATNKSDVFLLTRAPPIEFLSVIYCPSWHRVRQLQAYLDRRRQKKQNTLVIPTDRFIEIHSFEKFSIFRKLLSMSGHDVSCKAAISAILRSPLTSTLVIFSNVGAFF